jgi:hypothetical protein
MAYAPVWIRQVASKDTPVSCWSWVRSRTNRKRAQRPREVFVLPVEALGHHGAKPYCICECTLHELGSYLKLGRELRIGLALTQVIRGGVRLEGNSR